MTWDAVEHAGPGQYDKEYLAYLRALLESLRGTGLVAYVVSLSVLQLLTSYSR